MPAIITHDQFALDVLDALAAESPAPAPGAPEPPGAPGALEPPAAPASSGTPEPPATPAPARFSSPTEQLAFRLGSQGPDPLFYVGVHPLLHGWSKLGSSLHADDPTPLFSALARSVGEVPAHERPVARAWACGFLCHYLLDRAVHPLVYAQEYAICDAGVPGLTRDDGSEVHAVIESEIDEVVLFAKRGQTVASFLPHREILRLDDVSLSVVSRLVSRVEWARTGRQLPFDVFETAVRCFRFVQMVFDSPDGLSRSVLGRLEELVRPYSLVRAMSHRPIEATECDFDNHAHDVWLDPDTGVERSEDFWDLYYAAMAEALQWVGVLADGGLAEGESGAGGESDAGGVVRELTGGRNFSGVVVG